MFDKAKKPQLEWVGEKCGIIFPEEPPADVSPKDWYKPGDREPCQACGDPWCWARVRVRVSANSSRKV